MEQELRKKREEEKTGIWKRRRPFLLGTWMEREERVYREPSEEKDSWKGVRKALIWRSQEPSGFGRRVGGGVDFLL